MHVRRTANDDHESLIHDIIIAGEKQAPQSGICFSEEIEDFLYDITSKRPMKSDREH